MISITKQLRLAFSKLMTVREAIGSAMEEEIQRDPKVFLIGEEVG